MKRFFTTLALIANLYVSAIPLDAYLQYSWSTDQDQSLDPISGFVLLDTNEFIWNMRRFGISKSGWMELKDKEIQEDYLDFLKRKFDGEKYSSPVISHKDESDNPIVDLVIQLFPSIGGALNTVGSGSLTELIEKNYPTYSNKDDIHIELMIEMLELAKDCSRNGAEYSKIEDKIKAKIENKIEKKEAEIASLKSRGNIKNLFNKIKEIHMPTASFRLGRRCWCGNGDFSKIKFQYNGNTISVKEFLDEQKLDFKKAKAVLAALEKSEINSKYKEWIKEYRSMQDKNSPGSLALKSAQIELDTLGKIKTFLDFEGKSSILEALKQKFVRILYAIIASVAKEKSGEYPPNSTINVINAYIWNITDNKDKTEKYHKKLCEAFPAISRASKNATFSNVVVEYLKKAEQGIGPWIRSVPSNGSATFQGHSFADCVETSIRMFFAFLVKNTDRSWLSTKSGDKFAKFFTEHPLSDIASRQDTAFRSEWAEALYDGIEKIKYELSDPLFKQNNCELRSGWQTVLRIICLKLANYNFDKAREGIKEEAARRFDEAKKCIQDINGETLGVFQKYSLKEITKANIKSNKAKRDRLSEIFNAILGIVTKRHFEAKLSSAGLNNDDPTITFTIGEKNGNSLSFQNGKIEFFMHYGKHGQMKYQLPADLIKKQNISGNDLSMALWKNGDCKKLTPFAFPVITLTGGIYESDPGKFQKEYTEIISPIGAVNLRLTSSFRFYKFYDSDQIRYINKMLHKYGRNGVVSLPPSVRVKVWGKFIDELKEKNDAYNKAQKWFNKQLDESEQTEWDKLMAAIPDVIFRGKDDLRFRKLQLVYGLISAL